MTYCILGFQTTDTSNGHDVDDWRDTKAEAVKSARYWLTDEYRQTSESSRNLVVVQIWKDETLVEEITAKKLSYQDRPGEYNWTYPAHAPGQIWISNPEGDIIGKADNAAYAEKICAALQAYDAA